MIEKSDLLVPSDYNNLYFSAKAHVDSKGPKIETAKALNIEDNDGLYTLFKNGDWKRLNISRFFKVKNYKSKEIIFQHMSGKENAFNNRKKRYEETIRFRNCDVTQHPTSVDIEGVVRSGGYIVETLKGLYKII